MKVNINGCGLYLYLVGLNMGLLSLMSPTLMVMAAVSVLVPSDAWTLKV